MDGQTDKINHFLIFWAHWQYVRKEETIFVKKNESYVLLADRKIQRIVNVGLQFGFVKKGGGIMGVDIYGRR